MSDLKNSAINTESLLTPECGHNFVANNTKSSNNLVIFQDFLLKKTRCVCTNCYSKDKDKINQEKRQSIPLQNDLKCILCNSVPSRFKLDWSAGCCDNCFYVNRDLEEMNVKNQISNRNNIVPDCIIENKLYVGPKESATNNVTLKNLRISRVIVCCHSIPFYLESDISIQYLRLCMDDSLEQNLTCFIPFAFAFIQEGFSNNESILIHCNAGVSRSGAICIAWLMKMFDLKCDQALMMARSKRENISPNSNFIKQLDELKLTK